MIRVLHLLSCAPDLHATRLSEALREIAGPGFRIHTRTIGRGGDYRNCAHAAIALRRGDDTSYEVVHAWDTTALIAGLAAGTAVIYSPSRPPPASMCAWIARAAGHCNLTIAAPSESMRGILVRRGIPAKRCQMIPPPIDFGRIMHQCDNGLRETLGFAPEDIVLLAPGESVRSARHALAVHVASIMHVLDHRYRILLWGRGANIAGAARLGPKLHQARLITIAERCLKSPIPFERLLEVADIVLWTGTNDAPAVPLALSMAAGLPIMATAAAATYEYLEDGRTALIAPQPAPRQLAERILELAEHPERRAALGEAAREAAHHLFGVDSSTAQLLALYQSVINPRPPL
jgi:glycosyltransferase involved in cell wall biosynthesis